MTENISCSCTYKHLWNRVYYFPPHKWPLLTEDPDGILGNEKDCFKARHKETPEIYEKTNAVIYVDQVYSICWFGILAQISVENNFTFAQFDLFLPLHIFVRCFLSTLQYQTLFPKFHQGLFCGLSFFVNLVQIGLHMQSINFSSLKEIISIFHW